MHSFICMCQRSCLHYRTWRKITFEFGESSGKLGLKMTNRTHTDKRNMVSLSYFVPGYDLLYPMLIIFINQRTLEWSGE